MASPDLKSNPEKVDVKEASSAASFESTSLPSRNDDGKPSLTDGGVVAAADGEKPTAGDAPEQDDEENIEYPKKARLAIIMLGIAMAVFIVFFDMTVISTAIPSITNQFRSLDDIGWYGSAYMLTVRPRLVAPS